jgi:hypothetical protein
VTSARGLDLNRQVTSADTVRGTEINGSFHTVRDLDHAIDIASRLDVLQIAVMDDSGNWLDLTLEHDPFFTSQVVRATSRQPSTMPAPGGDVAPPRIALRILGRANRARYAREWGAHLWQLADEGALRQARRDRRRMVLGAPSLAIRLRWRAAFRRRTGR